MTEWRKLEIEFTEKQEELYDAFLNDLIEEILFWWWWRWWKTRWMCEILNITCLTMPWIVWLVWRKERDDLRKTSINTLFKVLSHHRLRRKVHWNINRQTKEFTYYNWSKIIFAEMKYYPSDPEYDRFWSYEVTHAWIDEAQQVERKVIDVVKSRLTEKVAEYNIVPKMMMTCNPDKWHLYTDFIKPSKDWTLAKNRAFIQSLYTDNPYLDHAKYRKQFTWSNKITIERILNWNREYDDSPWRLFIYDKICDLATNQINWIWKWRYISCDVARFGKDKTVIRVWEWLKEIDKYVFDKSSIPDIINKIKQFCAMYEIPFSNVVIDEDGVWWWVVDWVKWCKWFINWSSPIDTRTEEEKRAGKEKPNFWILKDQCYFKLAELVNDWRIQLLELTEELKQELDNIVQLNIDKDDQKLRVITKENLKKKIWRSPDESDSLMMRMLFELLPKKRVVYASI